MRLSCIYQFRPKKPTCHTSYVQTVFGIGFEAGPNVIARDVEIDYRPGRIVLFVGPSGSGKSSLLRAAAGQVESPATLAEFAGDGPADDERALIDTLGDDVKQAAHLLSLCGLGEAFLMLRSPAELSDGQRYRYAIARCLAGGQGSGPGPDPSLSDPIVPAPTTPAPTTPDPTASDPTAPPATTIVADEWCAKLDRVTARVISRNVRKIADRRGVGFLLATTHEDLLEDLQPDTIVRCRGGGRVEVENRPPFAGRSVFFAASTSPREPSRTGRTSLGGITAGTGSAPSAG